jgi:hypothetical protein
VRDPLRQLVGPLESGGQLVLPFGVEEESHQMDDLLKERGGFQRHSIVDINYRIINNKGIQ